MISLEQIYSEICYGYSEIGDGCRIRHLSFVEQSFLQKHYDEAFKWAKQAGLKTEEEILNERHYDGSWPISKAMHLKSLQQKIDGLERSKPKVKTRAQIDSIFDSLCKLREESKTYIQEKYSFLNESAEMYADSRLRFHHILASVEKDGHPFKTEEELDYYDSYNELEKSYFIKLSVINPDNIKKICIESFFYNSFSLVESPSDFFGVPVFKLSTFQTSLLKLGQTFAKVATEISDLPKEYDKCPERMLMYWYFLQNGGKQVEEEQENVSNKFKSLHSQLLK